MNKYRVYRLTPHKYHIWYKHTVAPTHTHIYSISRPFRLIFTSRALLGCSLFFRTAIWMNGSPLTNLSCRHCIKTAKVGFCGCGKWLKEAMVKLIVFLLKRIKQYVEIAIRKISERVHSWMRLNSPSIVEFRSTWWEQLVEFGSHVKGAWESSYIVPLPGAHTLILAKCYCT